MLKAMIHKLRSSSDGADRMTCRHTTVVTITTHTNTGIVGAVEILVIKNNCT